MAYKWMTQDSDQWTKATMESFIISQNNYSYDGQRPQRHSAEALANFAYLKGKQRDIFIKVYDKIYAKEPA
jgi:hypothetical protein